MTGSSLPPSELHTDAEYQVALSAYINEIQSLLDAMKTDQIEIDRLKHSSEKTWAEIDLLRNQTREILQRIETIV